MLYYHIVLVKEVAHPRPWCPVVISRETLPEGSRWSWLFPNCICQRRSNHRLHAFFIIRRLDKTLTLMLSDVLLSRRCILAANTLIVLDCWPYGTVLSRDGTVLNGSKTITLWLVVLDKLRATLWVACRPFLVLRGHHSYSLLVPVTYSAVIRHIDEGRR